MRRAVLLRGPASFTRSPAGLRAAEEALASGRRQAPQPGGAALPGRRGPAKVLLFRSLFAEPGKDSSAMHLATWQLASALRAAGIKVVLSDLKLSADGRRPENPAALRLLLLAHPDLDFAGITLYESCFEGVCRLAALVKKALPACRVAVGGVMPTLHPLRVLAHLPQADLLVRGDGERAFPLAVSLLRAGGPAAEAGLLKLKGLAYRDGSRLLLAGLDRLNEERDLDALLPDLSLLERRDLAAGLPLYFSRGCANSCSFCVSFSRGRFRGVSPAAAARWLTAYRARAAELFGGAPPAAALGACFYDDDFFCDRSRAAELLAAVRGAGLFVNFAQTGIRSFLKGGRPDAAFLRRLDAGAFRSPDPAAAGKTDLYVGTENFSAAELKVLGKGYGPAEAAAVAAALSEKGLRQKHHLILANAFTTAAALRENLAAAAALRRAHAPCFDLLRPVTPGLFSYFGTRSWARAEAAGLRRCLNVRRVLSAPGFPEYDLPLAGGDTPADPAAARLAGAAARRLNRV